MIERKKKNTTTFTENAHRKEVWLYLACDDTLEMVDLMFRGRSI